MQPVEGLNSIQDAGAVKAPDCVNFWMEAALDHASSQCCSRRRHGRLGVPAPEELGLLLNASRTGITHQRRIGGA